MKIHDVRERRTLALYDVMGALKEFTMNSRGGLPSWSSLKGFIIKTPDSLHSGTHNGFGNDIEVRDALATHAQQLSDKAYKLVHHSSTGFAGLVNATARPALARRLCLRLHIQEFRVVQLLVQHHSGQGECYKNVQRTY